MHAQGPAAAVFFPQGVGGGRVEVESCASFGEIGGEGIDKLAVLAG